MLLIRCVPLSVRIAALLLFVLRTLQTKKSHGKPRVPTVGNVKLSA